VEECDLVVTLRRHHTVEPVSSDAAQSPTAVGVVAAPATDTSDDASVRGPAIGVEVFNMRGHDTRFSLCNLSSSDAVVSEAHYRTVEVRACVEPIAVRLSACQSQPLYCLLAWSRLQRASCLWRRVTTASRRRY
jgi:hypothetical protein